MVSRSYIARNLRSLNEKYLRSKTQAEPFYYAKLAIIELCGWIETSIDEILESRAPKLVNQNDHLSQFAGRVKNTSGFTGKRHMEPLIVALVGYHGLEKLEASSDPSLLGALHRNLNELSGMRNRLAHTYIKDFTVTIESPQLILDRFNKIADGLDHLEEKLDSLAESQ